MGCGEGSFRLHSHAHFTDTGAPSPHAALYNSAGQLVYTDTQENRLPAGAPASQWAPEQDPSQKSQFTQTHTPPLTTVEGLYGVGGNKQGLAGKSKRNFDKYRALYWNSPGSRGCWNEKRRTKGKPTGSLESKTAATAVDKPSSFSSSTPPLPLPPFPTSECTASARNSRSAIAGARLLCAELVLLHGASALLSPITPDETAIMPQCADPYGKDVCT